MLSIDGSVVKPRMRKTQGTRQEIVKKVSGRDSRVVMIDPVPW